MQGGIYSKVEKKSLGLKLMPPTDKRGWGLLYRGFTAGILLVHTKESIEHNVSWVDREEYIRVWWRRRGGKSNLKWI